MVNKRFDRYQLGKWEVIVARSSLCFQYFQKRQKQELMKYKTLQSCSMPKPPKGRAYEFVDMDDDWIPDWTIDEDLPK